MCTYRYRHEMASDDRYLYVFGGGTATTSESLDTVSFIQSLNIL